MLFSASLLSRICPAAADITVTFLGQTAKIALTHINFRLKLLVHLYCSYCYILAVQFLGVHTVNVGSVAGDSDVPVASIFREEDR